MPLTTSKLTWLGHSTVRCDLPGGEVLLIDPWVQGNPACPKPAQRFDRLDAVLITHAHSDHLGDALDLCRKFRPAKVVATFEVCSWLASQGVENTAGMNLGGTQQILGASVTMVRADHSSGLFDGEQWTDGGEPTGYVVRLPDGFVFYHAGDTDVFSDMELIAELHHPRLAFLPIGDHFTMGPRGAALACRFLRVEQVVPIHWGTFPVLTGTPARLQAELAALGVDCAVRTLEPGGSL